MHPSNVISKTGRNYIVVIGNINYFPFLLVCDYICIHIDARKQLTLIKASSPILIPRVLLQVKILRVTKTAKTGS